MRLPLLLISAPCARRASALLLAVGASLLSAPRASALLLAVGVSLLSAPRASALLLAVGVSLLSAPTLAQPAPSAGRLFGTDEAPPPGAAPTRPAVVMRLDYIRAPGAEACPDEQVFRAAVGTHVRRWEPFAPNGPWRLLVIVSRRGEGYEGSAELRDVTGAVELRQAFPATRSCVDLLGDLARAVGFRIDPPAPPQAGGAALPPPVQPPALDAPTPAPLPPPRPVRFRVGASAWMDLATAPRPAFGISLDVGLRYRWFSIAAEARLDPPAGATVTDGTDVTTTRVLGALVPCGHVGMFAGCLLAEVGQLRGSIGTAGATPDHQGGLYLAAGGRVGVEIPVVDHLLVRVAADLTGARPAAFRLEGPAKAPQRTAWQTASFTGGLGAGLLASF